MAWTDWINGARMKNSMEGFLSVAYTGLDQAGHIQIGLEAVHLPAEGIPFDHNIHQLQQGLPAMDIFRKQNRPGASAPDGMPVPKLPQWLDQLKVIRHFANCR